MRDIDVRRALIVRLRAEHGNDPDTLIVEELGLCQGESRIDVAVVNGALNGFEIKSASDTLVRLKRQQEIYSACLETVTIVVAESHLRKVLQTIPDWWGILKAVESNGALQIVEVRSAFRNPMLQARAMVELLWRNEALEALSELGLDAGVRSKPRSKVWDRLSESLPPEDISTVVRNALKRRESWRSGQPQT